jgi:hypothetical protein
MPVVRREGDVVRIRHPHGLDRSRNRCPVCAILMADGPAPTCRRCGTRYRQVTDTDYQVVSVGQG